MDTNLEQIPPEPTTDATREVEEGAVALECTQTESAPGADTGCDVTTKPPKQGMAVKVPKVP